MRKVNIMDVGIYIGVYRRGQRLALLNLYIKGILNHISYDCKTIQFADDIVITCTYKDTDKIISSLQAGFNQIQEWLGSLGLELSLAKTQFMLFSRSKSECALINFNVNSGTIPSVGRVKYLGMILDSGLRWREHINFLHRSSKYINFLKWLIGRGWGLTLNT